MKSLIIKFLDWRQKRKLLKRAIFLGEVELFYNSKITLMEGSTKEDVILGEKARLWGTLISQSHGKIILGNRVKVGNDCVIGAVSSITIGDGTAIASNVTIMDNNNHPINPADRKFMYSTPYDSIYRRWKYSTSSPIVIGKNVWIGANSRINKGVNIGDNCIVAAHCVVVKDVPMNCIVAGNPGRIVKTDIHLTPRIFTEDVYIDIKKNKN